MIGLIEMLLTASVVSAAAALCLVSVPNAPPRVRFRVALLGLAAWAVPWPLLSLPLEVPVPAAVAEWRHAHEARVAQTGDTRPGEARRDEAFARDVPVGAFFAVAEVDTGGAPSGAGLDTGGAPRSAGPNATEQPSVAVARADDGIPLAAVLGLLFLPGAICFVSDAAALRTSLRAWRAASRSGEALRTRLPAELRDVRASIRIVRGSTIAATSGCLRPVVWLGERLADSDRKVALVHELAHVKSRDPLWITFVTLVRRAYWWNPAVAWLAREAVLAMEAACDRRCAGWFGVEPYAERLAAMMLDAVDAVRPPALRLLAHARTPNLNVRRLMLLERTTPRLRLRDLVPMVLTALLGAGAATYALAKPIRLVDGLDAAAASSAEPRPAWSRVPLPDTPAGDALAALLGAFNAGDSERLAMQLGAFTPQELEFDVPRSSGGLELVAIIASAALRIEYVVQDRAGGTRRLGELEVAAWDTSRIARLDVRAAPAGREHIGGVGAEITDPRGVVPDARGSVSDARGRISDVHPGIAAARGSLVTDDPRNGLGR